MGTIISTSSGGDYGVGGTWIGGIVPLSSDDVVIATTGGNKVVITDTRQAKNLTINLGAILRGDSTGKLEMYGNFLGVAGVSWTNTGSRFEMVEDGFGNGFELDFKVSPATFEMDVYSEVDWTGPGAYTVSNEPIWIHSSAGYLEYVWCINVVGEIHNVRIHNVRHASGVLYVSNLYQDDLADYPMHLGQITMEYWQRRAWRGQAYLHADTLLTYRNPVSLSDQHGLYVGNLFGEGKVHLDYTGYTGAPTNYLIVSFGIFGSVYIDVDINPATPSFTYDSNPGADLRCHEQATYDIETQKAIYSSFYDDSSLIFRHTLNGVPDYINLNIYWYSAGIVQIFCDPAGDTSYINLMRNHWVQKDGFRLYLTGTCTGDVRLDSSGDFVNDFSMKADFLIVNETGTDLDINEPINQYDPVIYATDEGLKEAQIYWSFKYPYNRDDPDFFELTNAQWSLSNLRIDIDPYGTAMLFVQPVSFVAGIAGIVSSTTGTVTLEYSISQDGGVTWSPFKTLNDANWGAESGYQGFGNESINIRVKETAGSAASISELRLPIEYRDLYTSQLSLTQMGTQTLGLTVDQPDRIWEEPNLEHVAGGTFGKLVNDIAADAAVSARTGFRVDSLYNLLRRIWDRVK